MLLSVFGGRSVVHKLRDGLRSVRRLPYAQRPMLPDRWPALSIRRSGCI